MRRDLSTPHARAMAALAIIDEIDDMKWERDALGRHPLRDPAVEVRKDLALGMLGRALDDIYGPLPPPTEVDQ